MLSMELLKPLAPLIAVECCLKAYCLVLLSRTEPRFLPKWAWALIILVLTAFGSIGFLILGRSRD